MLLFYIVYTVTSGKDYINSISRGDMAESYRVLVVWIIPVKSYSGYILHNIGVVIDLFLLCSYKGKQLWSNVIKCLIDCVCLCVYLNTYSG